MHRTQATADDRGERATHPAFISFVKSSSVLRCVSTKMRIEPRSYHKPRSWRRRGHRPLASCTSTICSTVEATFTRPPTMISIGLCPWFRILRAKRSTCAGNVALNITVWREGRMFLTIIVIWGSKPISNIRSASSKTRYLLCVCVCVCEWGGERVSEE